MDASLSYWNTNYGCSDVGTGMPPILIESDCGVVNFINILLDRSERNLLVTFKSNDEGSAFKTPVRELKRKGIVCDGNSVVGKSNLCGSSLGETSCPKPGIIIDDSGLVEAAELLEEQYKSNGKSKGKSVQMEPSWDLLDEEDMSDGVEVDVLKEDVRSNRYDTKFWKPLVEDEYGGSNAVDVVFGEAEEGGFVDLASNDDDSVILEPKIQPKSNAKAVKKRKLEDVLDEEFDVDPLYDDTRYERSEILDLDMDENDDEFYVGKTFENKLDCQICLAIYAIKRMFYFKQSRSTRNYIVVRCADTLCEWRVTACEIRDGCYYKITKALLVHSCSIETRIQYTRLVSSKVIAAIYRSKYGEKEIKPRSIDLQQMLLEELRVSSSYTKCWRATEFVRVENKGSEEDAYLNLLSYLYMLKIANPGTIADVETVDDGSGGERFLYMFLAFGASIMGFRRLRPVIVIDGTHLSGNYKGVLLTASGQDGNFQVFPLAFVVVDIEDVESWTWFLAKVQLIIVDSPRLIIILDRANSILKAVKAVFPTSKHGACVLHLSRNVLSGYKSKELAQLVTQAACAYTVGHFNIDFGEIKNRSEECGKYLLRCGLANWTRAYFEGDRYNMMTSNIAESLNNAVRKGRSSPITELVMFI